MKVSVLMPVFNGEKYLTEAIESILKQTFADFELLIINDCSTDRTENLVLSQTDKRIRLVRNDQNLGLAASLNKGMALAKGEYVARMDCDDFSLPERLAEQVAFLDQNPEIHICGTWVQAFGENGETVWEYPTDPDHISCQMLFNCCVAHPSIMIRKQAWHELGLAYDPAFRYGEDYELWLRENLRIRFANIPKVLLRYRLHQKQMSKTQTDLSQSVPFQIRTKALAKLLETRENERIWHETLSREQYETNPLYFQNITNWLWKLRKANLEKRLYPEPIFSEVIFWRGWWSVVLFLKNEKKLSLRILARILFSPFASYVLRKKLGL